MICVYSIGLLYTFAKLECTYFTGNGEVRHDEMCTIGKKIGFIHHPRPDILFTLMTLPPQRLNSGRMDLDGHTYGWTEVIKSHAFTQGKPLEFQLRTSCCPRISWSWS